MSLSRSVAKVVLLVIALALVAGAVSRWEFIYWFVTTKRVQLELPPSTVGWKSVKRWGDPVDHGKSVIYNAQNGCKLFEVEFKNGNAVRGTYWWDDGRVHYQIDRTETKTSPPWWWDVEDQADVSSNGQRGSIGREIEKNGDRPDSPVLPSDPRAERRWQ